MLHLLEIASVLTLFIYLYFAYKQQAKAWLFGVLGSLLSAVLFYYNAYYGSMVLYLIYAIQGIIGFWEWQWNTPNAKRSYQFAIHKQLIYVFCSVLLSVGLYFVFKKLNYHEFNVIDIFLALLSLFATYLEIKKEIACWNYWMFCNLGYAILYLNLHKKEEALYLYASFMLVLAVFSWFAKRKWILSLTNQIVI